MAVLVARDRAGATVDCVLKTINAATIAAALKPYAPPDIVLCTDGSHALAAAARQLGVEHHAVNLSAGVRMNGAWQRCKSLEWSDHSASLRLALHPKIRTLHPVQLRFLGSMAGDGNGLTACQ